MQIECEAVVVAVRAHAEHGAIVRVMTAGHGLLAGYVRGGRSRRLRPVLVPGNRVVIDVRARSDAQLAAMTLELAHGIGPLLSEPLAAAAIEWVTALVATALPEGQPYPRIHGALDGVLSAVEAAPSARSWAPALAAFEGVVLSALGYGADGDAADMAAALDRTGAGLARDVLTGWQAAPLAARARLIERLSRAVA